MDGVTCPRCDRTLKRSTLDRTLHADNCLFEVPNTTDDPEMPACISCCADLEDEGKIELPEEQGIEDCHVYYETTFEWIAEAVVLREDWRDPRGNILAEYLGPAPDHEQPDDVTVAPSLTREEAKEAGEDLVTLTYDVIRVVDDEGNTTP